jgi:hypothetical protein
MSTPFPTSIFSKIRRLRLDLNENKARFPALISRKRQVVSLAGGTADRWEGVIETVPLDGTDLRLMWAFLLKVGLYGEFTMGDPDYAGPISGQASILVNGAGQSGMVLNCDAATPSVITLREGEYFQLGNGFHAMTADAIANGSGQVTLNFKPALRASPADNATVELANPKMLHELTSAPSKDTDDDKSCPFVLSFQESL